MPTAKTNTMPPKPQAAMGAAPGAPGAPMKAGMQGRAPAGMQGRAPAGGMGMGMPPKPPMPGMKAVGKVKKMRAGGKCRGMGAATRGGDFMVG